MIKAIILDDEEVLGKDLKKMIESCHPEVKVMAVCSDFKETEEALNRFMPDIVFLDVELGNGQTSFDLLKRISPINFKIIFTTAYSKYSVQAIKFSAIDYLLKPIDENELSMAIEKFGNRKNKADSSKTESLLAALTRPGDQQNKIPLPTKEGYDLITIADIIYCEVVKDKTLLMLNNNDEMIIYLTLTECEDLLTPYNFFRIHKSYLINLNHVKKYVKGKDGIAIVSNNANLTVTRNFKQKFIEKLKTAEF